MPTSTQQANRAKAQRHSRPAALRLVWYDNPARHLGDSNDDPLGLHHLEEKIADWFWPGFARRTTRAGYFVMVLYGLQAVEDAIDKYGLPRDDDTRRFLFGRFERLWCMSQLVASEGVIEAEDRMHGLAATSRLFHQRGRHLPVDFLHLEQGEVGALGTYLPALRAHRLVAQEQLRLTPLGWDLAQWQWDAPQAADGAWDELVQKILSPKNHEIPMRVGRATLAALGEKCRLSRIGERPDLQALLRRRLLEATPTPATLACLPQMTAELIELQRADIREPHAVLNELASRRPGKSGHQFARPAQVALCFAALGGTMLRIFDRVHATLVAAGYAAEWSACVQAAVTEELVADLNVRMADYRRLGCNEQIEVLSPVGRVFGQTMRRFNTQNPYNTFESILNLHTTSQRAASKGEGWIARAGETVFLRQASTDVAGAHADAWQPSFRIDSMAELCSELGYAS